MKKETRLNPIQIIYKELNSNTDNYQEKAKKLSKNILGHIENILTNPNNYSSQYTKEEVEEGYRFAEELIERGFPNKNAFNSGVIHRRIILYLYEGDYKKSNDEALGFVTDNKPYCDFIQTNITGIKDLFELICLIHEHLLCIDESIDNIHERFIHTLPERLTIESVLRERQGQGVSEIAWSKKMVSV